MPDEPHSEENIDQKPGDDATQPAPSARPRPNVALGFASVIIQLILGMLVGNFLHGGPVPFLIGFGATLVIIAWIIAAVLLLIGKGIKQAWLRRTVIWSWVAFGVLLVQSWLSA